MLNAVIAWTRALSDTPKVRSVPASILRRPPPSNAVQNGEQPRSLPANVTSHGQVAAPESAGLGARGAQHGHGPSAEGAYGGRAVGWWQAHCSRPDVICPLLRVIGTEISGWGDRGSGSATGPFYPFICQTAGHCSLSLIIAVLVATGA